MLMAYFLEKEFGSECQYVESLNATICNSSGTDRPPEMVLWDCYGKEVDSCISELNEEVKRMLNQDYLVLFNVNPDSGFEEKALTLGVRGFFYINDSLEQLIRGISAIFKGELWAPRWVMSEYIIRNHNHDNPLPNKKTMLTNRENEILSMVAGGLSNDQIAEKLCISPYTVKTHVHNILKKINASSRMQAMLWTMKHSL
ncbi:MAG: response regulator transcription factor [Pseudomonadota bacterium]